MNRQAHECTGSVRVAAGSLVLDIAGAVDEATLSRFRALLDEVMTVGARQVMVDMASGEFLDPSGPTVLLMAAERLRSTGGHLRVRGVPPPFDDLFALNGLADGAPPRLPTTPALVDGLVALAGIPGPRQVLDAALKLVVTMAQAVVVGADGVSITLPRNGQLTTVAASNDVVLEMDLDQYATAEGPCLDAATSGRRFHIDSLAHESRWPAFVPRAKARGIETILSAPLMTDDQPVGALNLYSRKTGAFAEHEKAWAEQFAAEASAVVSSARPAGSVDLLAGQISEALRSREAISLAQGLVMHRDGVSAEAAYCLLRDVSRRTGQPLREVCADVLGRGNGSAGGEADV